MSIDCDGAAALQVEIGTLAGGGNALAGHGLIVGYGRGEEDEWTIGLAPCAEIPRAVFLG